ncbi:MAG: DNA-directed RNA polymerase subunit alpha [Nitrospinota bacterium]|nr:DNA-directed RNA polymerase subunit alpha [Nitrospinota bacterium]
MSMDLQDMVSPKRLECVEKSADKTFGRFVAEPLERGFGATIGNSIRRYLLSSIRGAAVYAIKIEGIHHEFSTLPSIYEDVSEIILNFKELVIKHQEGTDKAAITIDESGKKEITGDDIKCPANVEVINKGIHIASLMDKNSNFKAELFTRMGRGYVPSEEQEVDSTDIALIPLDSNFSPILKVNVIVEKTRVGHYSDYDKLILDVWTNGTIDPEDAVSDAAKIQRDHMLLFMNKEDEIEIPVKESKAEKVKQPTINLNRSVEELELSVRSYNCLQKANIKTIAELVEKTDSEMLKTRNFGRKSLNEIKAILTEMGLRLGMSKEEIEGN